MHVPFVLAIIPWLLQGKRGVRLEGPEEIDRRERAPGAAAGMERMPSPPRARSSFCQPLSRPDRAATAGRLALIWAATPRAARQARQTPPPPPILELGGSGTVPRGDGRHACCARAAAFAGSKDMSPHYLLEVRIDFSYFLPSIWSLPVRLSRGYYRGRGWGLEAAAAAELMILMARPHTAWRPGSWKSTCLLPRLAGRERASLRRAALGAESGRCWQYTAALWGFNRTKTTAAASSLSPSPFLVVQLIFSHGHCSHYPLAFSALSCWGPLFLAWSSPAAMAMQVAVPLWIGAPVGSKMGHGGHHVMIRIWQRQWTHLAFARSGLLQGTLFVSLYNHTTSQLHKSRTHNPYMVAAAPLFDRPSWFFISSLYSRIIMSSSLYLGLLETQGE